MTPPEVDAARRACCHQEPDGGDNPGRAWRWGVALSAPFWLHAAAARWRGWWPW